VDLLLGSNENRTRKLAGPRHSRIASFGFSCDFAVANLQGAHATGRLVKRGWSRSSGSVGGLLGEVCGSYLADSSYSVLFRKTPIDHADCRRVRRCRALLGLHQYALTKGRFRKYALLRRGFSFGCEGETPSRQPAGRRGYGTIL